MSLKTAIFSLLARRRGEQRKEKKKRKGKKIKRKEKENNRKEKRRGKKRKEKNKTLRKIWTGRITYMPSLSLNKAWINKIEIDNRV